MEEWNSISREEQNVALANEPLYVEFAKQMLDPPGKDPRISRFFQGMLDVAHKRHLPTVNQKDIVENFHLLLVAANMSESEPSYGANKLLRCFQKQFMYRDIGRDYPFAADSVEPWREGILTVLGTNCFDEVLNDMYTRETQSNVVQRYNSLKFILRACVDQTEPSPQVIDVGCSQNLGLKKIALNGSFDSVKVGGNGRRRKATMRAYNDTVATPVKLGRSLGVDLFDLRDRSNVEWVYACSSYPSELLDADKLRETRELQSAHVPEVSFTHSDISKYLMVLSQNETEIVDRRLYDVAFASTSMYQMTEQERQAAYANIYRHLKPNGMLVIQDFTELVDGKLRFSGPGSDRYAYRTYIKPKAGDYEKPEEIFIWETARCTKVEIGLGSLSIKGAQKPVAELLLSAKQ